MTRKNDHHKGKQREKNLPHGVFSDPNKQESREEKNERLIRESLSTTPPPVPFLSQTKP